MISFLKKKTVLSYALRRWTETGKQPSNDELQICMHEVFCILHLT